MCCRGKSSTARSNTKPSGSTSLRTSLLLEDRKQVRLNVVGEDLAAGANELRETERHVPRACADVRDGHARLDTKERERLVGGFLLLAVASIEPRRIRRQTRDLPTRERM